MKLILTLPIDGVDANVKILNADGEEVKVTSIEIEPLFFQPAAVVPVLYGKVVLSSKARSEVRQQFSLGIGGKTGVCKMANRTAVVTPAIEQPPITLAASSDETSSASTSTTPEVIDLPGST